MLYEVITSALVNEWVELPRVISLLKLRASWAQVGNDTDPYKTSAYYETTDFPGTSVLPTTLHNRITSYNVCYTKLLRTKKK